MVDPVPQIAARLDERNHGEKECYGVFREEGSIAYIVVAEI